MRGLSVLVGWNEAPWELRPVSSQRPNKQKSNVLPGTALQRQGLPFALFGVLHESSTGREDGVDRGDVDTMVVVREGRRVQSGAKHSQGCLNAQCVGYLKISRLQAEEVLELVPAVNRAP